MSNTNHEKPEEIADSGKLLPLIPIEVRYPKDKMSNYRLLTDPADKDSNKYDFSVNQFSGTESIRELLRFVENVETLRKGMALTTTSSSDVALAASIVTRLLHGSAEDAFTQGMDEHRAKRWLDLRAVAYSNATASGSAAVTTADRERAAAAVPNPDVSEEDFQAGLQRLVTLHTPFRVLARVKRFLRRHCRKPVDMKFRTFVAHFCRINDKELPMLPPFAATNKLSALEVQEILQYAIPSSWSRKLQEQGHDPVTMNITEFITKVEFIEGAEEFTIPKKNDSSKTTSKSKGKGKSLIKDGDKPSHYCLHHGKNHTHDTNDCKVMKEQAKRVKSKDNGGSKSYGNKTWSRSANENRDKSKKELAMFISKTIRKELNSFSAKKKRKADLNVVERNDDASKKSDDDSLADFDYDKLENMSFDDNSSVGSTKSD